VNKLFFLSIITLSIIHTACSCSNCGKEPDLIIPLEILDKGNEYIISKIGKEFFEKNILIDYKKIENNSTNYKLTYRLYMPEKSFVNEEIYFYLDEKGNLLTDYEIHGVPDCLNNSEECSFEVDELIAVDIALDNGMKQGIKNWDKSFRWSDEFNKYVWHIVSYLEETGEDENYKSSGEEIIINPSNGEIISFREWQINN